MLQYKDADANKIGARLNAYYSSKEHKHTYTAREQSRAETVKDLLELAYKGTVYVNFRKQFIAIKLAAGALKRDNYFAKQFELYVKESNYKVVTTAQGTIIRIARA
jgi:hypothetical protein